jgi:hypothetical protein
MWTRAARKYPLRRAMREGNVTGRNAHVVMQCKKRIIFEARALADTEFWEAWSLAQLRRPGHGLKFFRLSAGQVCPRMRQGQGLNTVPVYRREFALSVFGQMEAADHETAAATLAQNAVRKT